MFGKKLRTDVTLTTDRLRLVPMTEAHALSMRNWGRHRSNLYREYNYCEMSEAELRAWFSQRCDRHNRYFSILVEDTVRGFIGLKEISPLRRRSVLGFAVDRNLEGTGIGTAAMRAFLPVYFTDMGFSSMDLFVYAYNERAIRLYRKLGFRTIGTTMDLFSNPLNFPSEEEERACADCFYRTDGGVYAKVFQMRLHAGDVGRSQ